MCRRAVRVNSQLKSSKQLVDNARLYCTNALEGQPKVHPLYLLFYSVAIGSLLQSLTRRTWI